MSVDIMDIVLRELESRGMLCHDVYAPFYVASYAMHVFNLMNKERQIYWESKRIPNLRVHLVFIAPPGGMQSYTLSMLGGEGVGVFHNAGIQIVSRQNMNEAALVGTITMQNGRSVTREGEAHRFSNGIIMIDEFSGITDALRSSFNNQMDTQLLAALDHGHIAKSVAGGNIEYDTNFTLWAGIQPARYDIQRGLGRRLCFLVNVPDENLKRELRRAIWKSKNIKNEDGDRERLSHIIQMWASEFQKIQRIDYDDSIFELYEELGLETYDMTSYDRIILGYHLARYGASEHIVLKVEDPLVQQMIRLQHQWRKSVINGPDLLQIQTLIKDNGYLNEEGQYEITRTLLNKASSTYQMSISDLHNKLVEMIKYGMIAMKNGKIVLIDDS